MIKISFQTFGCKLNFSETTSILSHIEGIETVSVKDADIHIIHSCTVTEHAEKKCRQAIRHAATVNPDVNIIVMGCYSQLRPEEIEDLPNVVLICGNESKFKLGEYINDFKMKKEVTEKVHNDNPQQFLFHPSVSSSARTRTFLKIQDGCDYFCTYCAVPYARGRSRSDTTENTMRQVKEAVVSGTKEIVISGVNIGDFGRKNGEDLYGLLKEMCEIDGLERIRISSIEPNLLETRILELAVEKNIVMPHFHIPLQAGTDKILKLMKRHYDTRFFADKVNEVKRFMPDACIAVDLITGFPGENDSDFMDTLSFIKSIPLSYLHIFSYSDRPNALASKYPEKVSNETIIERSHLLHELSAEMMETFTASFRGKKRKVLFETRNQAGKWTGWTDNYIRVEYASDENLRNKIIEVAVN